MVNDAEVANASEGGMTRSGRCYASEEVERRRQEIAKGKEKVTSSDNLKEALRPQVEKKKPVFEEDAAEFLKLIKQSEYSIVEQLKKTPARISLLSLILDSAPHRNALQKVLNEAYVEPSISPDGFERLVGQIQAVNNITFTDDEIDAAGTGHTKPLHITLRCKGVTVAKVLIDNGSALNVLPLSTLNQLPVDKSLIRPSCTVVRAFDGAKSEVVGDIDLELEIGPQIFPISFHIMDIRPAYSMLLGRPWIHSAGAIPSSLHQKVKFVIDGKLVTIHAEEALLVTKNPSVPYIEADEGTVENSFQSFEVANAGYVYPKGVSYGMCSFFRGKK